eukprot:GEZU01002172.1.p1 GENE.GEZU01002172.1~~GEZU01002172.1.p1  ORF type:complete len:475 (-),score=91.48 GEZU01002172.1:75-1499(-)
MNPERTGDIVCGAPSARGIRELRNQILYHQQQLQILLGELEKLLDDGEGVTNDNDDHINSVDTRVELGCIQQPSQPIPVVVAQSAPSKSDARPVCIIWDYENIRIPKFADLATCIERVRMKGASYGSLQKSVIYGNTRLFGDKTSEALIKGGFEVHHIAEYLTRKEAADKSLFLEMMEFAIDNPTGGTICLITADADFCQPCYRLRRRKNFKVVIFAPTRRLPSVLRSAADRVEDIYAICGITEQDFCEYEEAKLRKRSTGLIAQLKSLSLDQGHHHQAQEQQKASAHDNSDDDEEDDGCFNEPKDPFAPICQLLERHGSVLAHGTLAHYLKELADAGRLQMASKSVNSYIDAAKDARRILVSSKISYGTSSSSSKNNKQIKFVVQDHAKLMEYFANLFSVFQKKGTTRLRRDELGTQLHEKQLLPEGVSFKQYISQAIAFGLLCAPPATSSSSNNNDDAQSWVEINEANVKLQ